jgi:hypothetical protein
MKQIANTQTYVAVGMFIPAGAGDIYHEVIVIDVENRTTKTYQSKFNTQLVADVFAEKLVDRLTKNFNEELHPSVWLNPAVWIPTYWKKEFEGVA